MGDFKAAPVPRVEELHTTSCHHGSETNATSYPCAPYLVALSDSGPELADQLLAQLLEKRFHPGTTKYDIKKQDLHREWGRLMALRLSAQTGAQFAVVRRDAALQLG